MFPEDFLNHLCFDPVQDGVTGPMGTYVINICHSSPGIGQGHVHGLSKARCRCLQIIIGLRVGSRDLKVRIRPSGERMLKVLKDKYAGSFGNHAGIPSRVKWPTSLRGLVV